MCVFLLLAASFDGLQPVLAACHCNFFSTLANKLLLHASLLENGSQEDVHVN